MANASLEWKNRLPAVLPPQAKANRQDLRGVSRSRIMAKYFTKYSFLYLASPLQVFLECTRRNGNRQREDYRKGQHDEGWMQTKR